MSKKAKKPTEAKALTISVPEAGRRLGLGRDSSYATAARGEIPILQFGKLQRVPLAVLERMLAEGKRG
jgi:excisionase family DNA binding protein